MDFTCPLCQQPIADITGCNLIEDGNTATIVHPSCHDKEQARQDATRSAKLAEKQSLELEKLKEWNNLANS